MLRHKKAKPPLAQILSRQEELQTAHPDLELGAARIFIDDGQISTSGGVTAGMNPRNFAPLYAEETGFTPAKATEAMRLEAAYRALEGADLPIKPIAIRFSLATEQNLRRVLHRQFGILPSDCRLRFRARNPIDTARVSLSLPMQADRQWI